MKPILIAGGGIAGLSTAIGMQQAGFEVQVFERVPTPRGVGAGLIMAPNALRALASLGLQEQVIAAAHPLTRFDLLAQDGRVLAPVNMLHTEARYGISSHAIHRGDLHDVLVQHLKPGSLIPSKSVRKVREMDEGVLLTFADGTHAEGTALIAADGIHSAIRQQFVPSRRVKYAGYTCWRGVIPMPAANWKKLKGCETWGRKGRFGIVPLKNDRVYWFATVNAPASSPEHEAWTIQDLQINFAQYHPMVREVLAYSTGQALLWNDISDLDSLEHFAFGRSVLMGDAAHATTPNMGQGACMALEDAAHLVHLISKSPTDIVGAFKAFEQIQLGRTRQIVRTSRLMGRIAQLEGGLVSSLRNALMQLAPAKAQSRQLDFLYEVEFG